MHHMSNQTEKTKPIRVTVPVDPAVLEEFRALAEVQGVSVGRAMGEWLGATLEGVQAMRGILQKARQAPHLAVRELHSYALGLTDMTSELIEQSKGIMGIAASLEGLTPPVSNTGGKVAGEKKSSTRKKAP